MAPFAVLKLIIWRLHKLQQATFLLCFGQPVFRCSCCLWGLVSLIREGWNIPFLNNFSGKTFIHLSGLWRGLTADITLSANHITMSELHTSNLLIRIRVEAQTGVPNYTTFSPHSSRGCHSQNMLQYSCKHEGAKESSRRGLENTMETWWHYVKNMAVSTHSKFSFKWPNTRINIQ